MGGSVRPKTLKKCMKLNWNFQMGGEVLEKILSVGEVWIFSGITHYFKQNHVKSYTISLLHFTATIFNTLQVNNF